MVADDALGGQQHASDGSSVLQGNSRHLDGVDDTSAEQVLIDLSTGIETEIGASSHRPQYGH